MITSLLESIASLVTYVVSTLGYFGVFVCMIIESACIPLPSEIIMPFSGYLCYLGKFNIHLVALAGSLGNLFGAVAAYIVGVWGGRPFIERYGKYLLISKRDIDTSDSWFIKYGEAAVLFSRMLPIVRTFISLPAGIYRMRFIPFCLFSFIGSVPWCYFLAFVGYKLGENWSGIESYFRKADIFIGMLLLICAVIWVKRHLKQFAED